MNKQELKMVTKSGQYLSSSQMALVRMLVKNEAELHDYVERELDENPALEVKTEQNELNLEKTEDGETYREGPEGMLENDYGDEDEKPVHYAAYNRSRDDEYYEPTAVAEESINDYLMSQVRERDITTNDELIAEYIIGNLDEDGYLRRSPQAIANDITFSGNMEVETPEVKKVLAIVRELDPPGIGATDLRDCILLQLKRMDDNESVQLALTIVEHYFNEFSHKHFDKICVALNITDAQLRKAVDVIKSVNPKPGSAFSGSDSERRSQQLTPDFQIDIDDSDPENPQLLMTLFNRIPELQISESYSSGYREMMQRNKKDIAQKRKETVVKDAYERANVFIDALRLRQEKLALTMKAIMERQHEFLLTGDERKLKPMVLNDISQITGLDTSVISRVTSGKYVTTPWGVYSLKHFFSEGLMHEDGEEVSAREICSVLKELVDGEDKQHPLSDEKLCADLQERGYHIARRTIAKYRERLKIPVARLRKEM